MSLGLVMVGADVGDMVGLVDPSSQSAAAPGSSGGTHLLGWAVSVGALDGIFEGMKLGCTDVEGAAEVVGLAEVDGTMDGAWEIEGFELPVGVPVGLWEIVGADVDGAKEGEMDTDGADGEPDNVGDNVGVTIVCSRLRSPSNMSRNNMRSLGGGQGYSKTSSIWYQKRPTFATVAYSKGSGCFLSSS